MPALRARLRDLRDRWVDQTLVQVEAARVALSRDPGAVLILGESSCRSWAHADTDQTLIPEMIANRIGAATITVAGAGYDARMFDAVLGVLEHVPHRPRAVIVAVNVRTNTAMHVTDHPIYGHARSRAALARLAPPVRRIRALGRRGSVPRRGEMAAFRARPVTTRWALAPTIGAYLTRLECAGPPPWPVETERLRFDYFHGEEVGADNPGLAALESFGRRLTTYGVPAVAYWAQPPVARGEVLFPGEFTQHVHRNRVAVEAALLNGAPGLGRLLQPVLGDADFQDFRNGTEHYAYSGRSLVADAVTTALDTVAQ